MKFAVLILSFLGMVATACADRSLPLAWDASPSSSVSGYRLYLGNSSAVYDSVVDLGNVTSALVPGLREDSSYFFTLTAYDVDGVESDFSNEIVLPLVVPPPTMPATARLLNVSVRGFVRNDDDVMIGGFMIAGNSNKRVMLRGLGPSLANQGVMNAMLDPVLELHDATGASLATNARWVTQQDEILATGMPPTDSREAALVVTLPPGMYSAVLSSATLTPGIGLFEIYDMDPAGSSELVNLSTRGVVGQGDSVMIGGFIVGGGTTSAIILRAIGPSLRNVLPNVLADPVLELHDKAAALVFRNDDWANDQLPQILATTIAPTDPKESAIYTTLQSGRYSGVLRGMNDATGVALIEIYNLGSITPALP